MSKKDYYAVLGVPKSATQEDIKKAFKRLGRQYHPDKNPGNKAAEDKFKEASEAYAVLGNAQERQKYDQMGESFPGFDMNQQWQGFRDFDGAGFEDIFGDLFGNIFGARGGQQRRQRGPAVIPGQDIETAVEVPLESVALGGKVPLTLTLPRSCPACQGQGHVTKMRVCATCGGGGVVQAPETITVAIPPGLGEGKKLRIKGKGALGSGGGVPGDLYIVVQTRPHAFFKREGQDLACDVPVTFGEAATGAEVQVPTLTGPVTLRVPAGTQGGQRMRLKGKGLGGAAPGDLYVTIQIAIPKNLDPESREMLRKLDQKFALDPRKELETLLHAT